MEITTNIRQFSKPFATSVIGMFALIVFAQKLYGQVTIDAVSTAASAGNVASLTWSHTVAGTNKVLVVTCAADGGTASNVTYGGVGLTKVDAINVTFGTRSEIWYLLNPTSGTANIVWTHSPNEGLVGCGISFNGVNQTTPLGTAVKATATAASSTLAVTSADGDIVIDVITTNADAVTVGVGQTEHYNVGSTGFVAGATSTFLEQCPGTTTNMTWTFAANDPYAHVAVPIKAISTISPVAFTTSAAGTDQNACGSTTATLAGNTVAGGETGLWTKLSGGGTITTPSSPVSGITALTATPGNFRWTITHTASGCTSSDDVTITRGNTIAGGTASATTSVCTGGTSSLSLASETTAGCTRQWQQNTNGGGWVNIGTGLDPQTTGALTNPNTYDFRCIVTETATGCNSTSTTTSTVSPSATATASAAGGDQSICSTTATFAGNTPGVGTGAWSKISGSGTITTPTSPTSGITALGVGANTFRWTITNGGCSSTDDVIITNGDASATLAYKSTNCPASTTDAVLSLTASGVIIQWQENINGAGWNNIVGATTTPYNVSGIDATYTFRANVTTGCGTYTINAASTVTSLSFIDYSGGFGSSYATYNSAGNCYSGLTAGQTYCYAFIYSHFIELNWMTDGCAASCPGYQYTKLFSGGSSTATSSGCGGSVSASISGNCAETTVNCAGSSVCNPSMYDNACGLVQSNGMQFGSGCAAPAMTEGNVYYICFTVPAGCGGMNMCPMMKCETGNCAASPLPIELLYFNATAVEGKVQLNWATESETNNDYFSIERTTDGIHFELVAEVDGAGNSTGILNYSLVDETPLKGISYYRLRQTDYDGKVGYSKLASVELANESPLKLIYVSPNQDKNTLQYQFSYTQEKPLKVEVLDVVGKTIYSEKVSSDANGQALNMDASGLSKGIYLLKISDGVFSEIKKFIY